MGAYPLQKESGVDFVSSRDISAWEAKPLCTRGAIPEVVLAEEPSRLLFY
jgi:hypothetical protein